ncbi:MAG: hypothetical protein IJU81_05410 [Bacteroidales bacterium]|nr:hypothetical protein [Bacteroidales bacterium]
MKQTVLLFLALLMAGGAAAQVDRDAYNKQRQQMIDQYNRQKNKAQQQYDDARRKAEAEYAAFRKKANAEYAAAVRQGWAMMGVKPAVPKPAEPAPPKPPAPQPDKTPAPAPLPKSEVVPAPPKPEPVPLPLVPEPEPSAPTMQVPFYGTSCSMHADAQGLRFSLPALDEASIATAWQQLSLERYDGLLHDCMAQRERLHLSDWGYLCLLGRTGEQLLGKGSNEAVLLQMYLLAQSGYRVRLGRADGRLVLLMPFSRTVYSYSYVELDGIKHYILSSKDPGGVYVCKVAFPRERVADILMGRLPDLGGGAKRSRTLRAAKFGTLQVTVAVEQRLMDYLADYPLSDAWDYYALAGLSDGVKATLYPALRSQIEGKSKKKAAAMLLDFVQTAFDYATDQEQFGYERPLFGDESFYYPKNDCEDRSILFCILVRDLLGLDAVLVNWPGHLATAVALGDEVQGDYFTLDGRRYTVCDPTYIGANIGETMPQFRNVEAKLVKL